MPNEKSLGGQPVEAKCPNCKELHMTKITMDSDWGGAISVEWTGKGKPWKYCQGCKSKLGMLDNANYPRIDYDVHEGR